MIPKSRRGLRSRSRCNNQSPAPSDSIEDDKAPFQRTYSIELGQRLIHLVAGFTFAALAGTAGWAIGALIGGPPALYATLAGFAMFPIARCPIMRPGLDFAAGTLLRVAVVLLGFRISFAQIVALGPEPIIITVTSLALGLAFAIATSRRLGLGTEFGLIAGMAVSICGVSAALTTGAILSKTKRVERDVLYVSLTVTVLSTIAMIAYPLFVTKFGLKPIDIGVFLGATIHDIAQVIGAGYGVSATAGDAAVITKLVRVSMLAPTVLLIGAVISRTSQQGRPRVPLFILGFIVAALLNTGGVVPQADAAFLAQLGNMLFLASIAAIALKTSWRDIINGGWQRGLLVLVHTALLACLVGAILIVKAKLGG